jgi:hypothetical protein
MAFICSHRSGQNSNRDKCESTVIRRVELSVIRHTLPTSVLSHRTNRIVLHCTGITAQFRIASRIGKKGTNGRGSKVFPRHLDKALTQDIARIQWSNRYIQTRENTNKESPSFTQAATSALPQRFGFHSFPIAHQKGPQRKITF